MPLPSRPSTRWRWRAGRPRRRPPVDASCTWRSASRRRGTRRCTARAVVEAIESGTSLGYTNAPGLHALRQRIARHYADEHGVSVDADDVLVVGGASPASRSRSSPASTPVPVSACWNRLPLLPEHADRARDDARPDPPWVRRPAGCPSPARPRRGGGRSTDWSSPRRRTPRAPCSTPRPSPAWSPTARHAASGSWPTRSTTASPSTARRVGARRHPRRRARQLVLQVLLDDGLATGGGWSSPTTSRRRGASAAEPLHLRPPREPGGGLAAFDCREELDGHVARYAANRRLLLDGLRASGITETAAADGAF